MSDDPGLTIGKVLEARRIIQEQEVSDGDFPVYVLMDDGSVGERWYREHRYWQHAPGAPVAEWS